MTTLAARQNTDPSTILATALMRAGEALGLSRTELGAIIGRDRTTLARGRLDPASKAGELALLLIRCYRSLYVLVGGDEQALRHWMRTPNRHTRGIPAEQLTTVQGLVEVTEYLDAVRGKV